MMRRRRLLALLGACGLVAGATFAANASTTTHRLPTITQLVREGKLTEINPATGNPIPFNNCESNYASPYWTLTLGSVKYYMEWHPNANPPQVYSTAGGPHTNYCFYVVSGHDYYVIQQAETNNCLAINNGLVPEIMYETGCNINVTTDTWDIGEWFGGSLVDRYDYLCAYGSINGGITITDDGGHCAAGYGNDGHIVWYSLLAPNSSPRDAGATSAMRPTWAAIRHHMCVIESAYFRRHVVGHFGCVWQHAHGRFWVQTGNATVIRTR